MIPVQAYIFAQPATRQGLGAKRTRRQPQREQEKKQKGAVKASMVRRGRRLANEKRGRTLALLEARGSFRPMGAKGAEGTSWPAVPALSDPLLRERLSNRRAEREGPSCFFPRFSARNADLAQRGGAWFAL